VVERLPSKFEALSSNLVLPKKKKNVERNKKKILSTDPRKIGLKVKLPKIKLLVGRG
jgi:hypothetical protein